MCDKEDRGVDRKDGDAHNSNDHEIDNANFKDSNYSMCTHSGAFETILKNTFEKIVVSIIVLNIVLLSCFYFIF